MNLPAPGAGEVSVLGLGRTGKAACRWLVEEGYRVYASDSADSENLRTTAKHLEAAGVAVDLGRHDADRICRSSLVVVSPGIPPSIPVLQRARAADVPVLAELEIASRVLEETKLAVVTGTNGKTTTTVLAGAMADVGGLESVVAGNIGDPLIGFAGQGQRPAWAVVEASSFQLHDCHRLTPAIGALTNLSPDHLDRYESLLDYYRDKRRLFQNARSDSVWILPAGDLECEKLIDDTVGLRRTFHLDRPADAWYDRDSNTLVLGDVGLVSRDDFALLGDHNIANALAAALIADSMGVGHADIATALKRARALPNRMEIVGEFEGKIWINDSKATNVGSTLVAVASIDDPFVVLMGGHHKGESYRRVGLALHEKRCRGVVAFGASAEAIAGDVGEYCDVRVVKDLNEAVSAAAAMRGVETVLLSPACSSFDQFADYEERGRQFRELVGSL